MTTPTIERVFEQSHIRRGRLATAPVFMVTAPDGARWRFHRRKDAAAFIEGGCVCAQHKDFLCPHCNGGIVQPAVACVCGHSRSEHTSNSPNPGSGCNHAELPAPKGTPWDSIKVGCACLDFTPSEVRHGN